MYSAINRRNPSLSFPPFSEPLVLQFSIFHMREFQHLNLLNNHFLSKGLCVIHHLLECAINYFKFSCLKLCSPRVIIFFNSKTLKSPVCKVRMKKKKQENKMQVGKSNFCQMSHNRISTYNSGLVLTRWVAPDSRLLLDLELIGWWKSLVTFKLIYSYTWDWNRVTLSFSSYSLIDEESIYGFTKQVAS